MNDVWLQYNTNNNDQVIDAELDQELTRSGFPRQFFRNVPHAIINPHRNTVNTLVNRGLLSQRDLRILNYIHSRTINIQREGFIDFTRCFTEGQRNNPNDQGTGIARTNVYASLKHLEKLGLIHSIIRGKIRITWVNLTFIGDLNTEWDDLPEQFKKHSEFMSGAFWDKLFTDYKFDRRLKTSSHFKFLETITKANADKLMEIDVMLRQIKNKKAMNKNCVDAYESMDYYDSHDPEYNDDPVSEVETNYKELDDGFDNEFDGEGKVVEPDVSDIGDGDIVESEVVVEETQELDELETVEPEVLAEAPTEVETQVDVLEEIVEESPRIMTEEEYEAAYYADMAEEMENERIQAKQERKRNAVLQYLHDAQYLDCREGVIPEEFVTKKVAFRSVTEYPMGRFTLHMLVDDGAMLIMPQNKYESLIVHCETDKQMYEVAGEIVDPLLKRTVADVMINDYGKDFGELK